MQAKESSKGLGTPGKRALMLSVLIVAVTFSWVLMLMYGNLPTLVLAGIALLSLLVLALATAWTALAFPSRSQSQQAHDKN